MTTLTHQRNRHSVPPAPNALVETNHRRPLVPALKYGRHADDQWSVDELLQLAARPDAN
jgi:hypothetical protein